MVSSIETENATLAGVVDEFATPVPSPWVVRFASLIRPGGHVLDLACGSGRHARYLAGLGYQVEAVDRNPDVLGPLGGILGIHTRQADLEGGPWPYLGRVFDGIVVSHYLWRPLLPQLFACLDEDGVLVYETFMAGNERFGKPSNPEHLLRPGELLDVVHRRLTVVAFEQGEVALPRPAMIQRIVARRGRVATLPG